jgi:CRP/FNR family transcriptional regulator
MDGHDRDNARRKMETKTLKTLRLLPFCSSLGEEDLRELVRIVTFRSCGKNEVILREEDTSRFMYVVFSGTVKVVQTGFDGKERILAIHRRGDFFGEMALLDGKTSPATVVAMEHADVGLIGKADFEEKILSDQRILREIVTLLCTRLREAWTTVKVLSFADAEQRIRLVLKTLSGPYGIREERGVLLSIKLTHKDIGDYASVSRETVTRLFDRLTHEGEIEILEKRRILLKPLFFDNTLPL